MDAEILKKSQEGAKKWRRFYSDRMGSGELRWCGTQYPTQSDAQEASMSFSEYEDFVYGAGLLEVDDPVAEWRKITCVQHIWPNQAK